MDILIFICLIIVIGVFFFLDKYNTSSNSMYIVIMLSLTGFFLLMNTTIDLVDYSAVNATDSNYIHHPVTDITSAGFGSINMQSFLVLAFWVFLALGIINIAYGKKEMNKNE